MFGMSVTAGQLRYEPSLLSISPPLPSLRAVHFSPLDEPGLFFFRQYKKMGKTFSKCAAEGFCEGERVQGTVSAM